MRRALHGIVRETAFGTLTGDQLRSQLSHRTHGEHDLGVAAPSERTRGLAGLLGKLLDGRSG